MFFAFHFSFQRSCSIKPEKNFLFVFKFIKVAMVRKIITLLKEKVFAQRSSTPAAVKRDEKKTFSLLVKIGCFPFHFSIVAHADDIQREPKKKVHWILLCAAMLFRTFSSFKLQLFDDQLERLTIRTFSYVFCTKNCFPWNWRNI